MDDKLSIRVNVADRYYPLKINREDEEEIRKAARMINEKVLQYKQKYIDKDIQDFLAMAALQYVIKLLEFEKRSEKEDITLSIKELVQQISEDAKEQGWADSRSPKEPKVLFRNWIRRLSTLRPTDYVGMPADGHTPCSRHARARRTARPVSSSAYWYARIQ